MSTSYINKKKKKLKDATSATIPSARLATGSNKSVDNAARAPDISFLKMTTAQLSSLIILSMAISHAMEFRRLAQSSNLAAVSSDSTASISSSFSEELRLWCDGNATTSAEGAPAVSSLSCSLTDQIWIQLKSTSSLITTLLLGIVIIFIGWRNDDWLHQFRSLYCLCPLAFTVLLCQVSQYRPELIWLHDTKSWQTIMKTIVLWVLSYSSEGWVLLGNSSFRNLFRPSFSFPRLVFLVASGLTLWECYQLVQLSADGWIPQEMAALSSRASSSENSISALLFFVIIDKLTQVVVYYFGFICLQPNERTIRNSSAQRSLLLGICLLQWLERYLTRRALQQLFVSYNEDKEVASTFSPSSTMFQLQTHHAIVLTGFCVVAWFSPSVTFQKVKSEF